MRISEITPRKRYVLACELQKCQWGLPADRIYFHKLSFVCFALRSYCEYVLLLCITRYQENHAFPIKSSVTCTFHHFPGSKIKCSYFAQNRTGPVVAVRTSERKVCTDKNIQKYKYVKYKAITAYTVSLSQVKLPLGAVAFPATDGSRLAAGDKYYPSFFLITR